MCPTFVGSDNNVGKRYFKKLIRRQSCMSNLKYLCQFSMSENVSSYLWFSCLSFLQLMRINTKVAKYVVFLSLSIINRSVVFWFSWVYLCIVYLSIIWPVHSAWLQPRLRKSQKLISSFNDSCLLMVHVSSFT